MPVYTTLEFLSVEKKVIDIEISKLFTKGVIVNTTRKPNDYASGIFGRTKKDGNYRMIVNMKTFNEFLKFKHCKQAFINYNFSYMRFCAQNRFRCMSRCVGNFAYKRVDGHVTHNNMIQ